MSGLTFPLISIGEPLPRFPRSSTFARVISSEDSPVTAPVMLSILAE